MTAKVLETTDKKYVGEIISTDLYSIQFSNKETVEIIGRAHLGSGRWKLWNSNYIITIQEETP